MATENQSTYSSDEISLPRPVRFWLMIVFEIPSLSCSIFILYHFIMDHQLRKSLKCRTIIILNITGFVIKTVDIPLYLNFLRVGSVYPPTAAHCLIWWFVDIGFYYTCGILAAWVSIERHILIFHHAWLRTSKGRLFGHYIPLSTMIIYMISFYTWVIFFPPCDNTSSYDYTLPVCGASPCYLSYPILGIWEPAVHGCVFTLIIIIFSISLIIRVLYGKHKRRQPIEWRKQRKMTMQMLSISLTFIIFNLPISVMYVAHALGLPSDAGVELELYFFYITYWLLFFMPFVCLNSLPNLKEKLKNMFRVLSRRQATVGTNVPATH